MSAAQHVGVTLKFSMMEILTGERRQQNKTTSSGSVRINAHIFSDRKYIHNRMRYRPSCRFYVSQSVSLFEQPKALAVSLRFNTSQHLLLHLLLAVLDSRRVPHYTHHTDDGRQYAPARQHAITLGCIYHREEAHSPGYGQNALWLPTY